MIYSQDNGLQKASSQEGVTVDSKTCDEVQGTDDSSVLTHNSVSVGTQTEPFETCQCSKVPCVSKATLTEDIANHIVIRKEHSYSMPAAPRYLAKSKNIVT